MALFGSRLGAMNGVPSQLCPGKSHTDI